MVRRMSPKKKRESRRQIHHATTQVVDAATRQHPFCVNS